MVGMMCGITMVEQFVISLDMTSTVAIDTSKCVLKEVREYS